MSPTISWLLLLAAVATALWIIAWACQRMAAWHVQIRDLEERVAQLSTDKLIFQDRLQQAQDHEERAITRAEQAEAAKDLAYQILANVEYGQRMGGPPFPEAPHLPVRESQKPGPIHQRMTPGQAMRKQTLETARKVLVMAGRHIPPEPPEDPPPAA